MPVRRGADGAVEVATPDGTGLAFDHAQLVSDAVGVAGIL